MVEKVDLLEQKRLSAHGQLTNQMHTVSSTMELCDVVMVLDEMKTFNNLHREFLNCNTILRAALSKDDYDIDGKNT